MRKKIVLSMTLLSAIVAGSISQTAHAAEWKTVSGVTGQCYRIYGGQSIECLRQTLEKICISLVNGSLCPNIPEASGPSATETPENSTPVASKPPVEETPDNSAPEVSNSPATQTPEASKPPVADIPDSSTPVATNPPATQAPAVSEPPVTDAGTSNTETLSYAQQVVRLVNAERAKAGLPALTVQTDITAAANVRAKEIRQKFSHTRPDGSSFSSALRQQGVSYRGSGENIAWGQKSPQQVMDGWMNSEGHRANILNKNFKNIGVGYYQDEKGVNYWVQLFTY